MPLPPELLSHVLELAYPSLHDDIVDFEHERKRKSDLLSAMLVSREWHAAAQPLYSSFVAFGSSEEIEEWLRRVEAGQIDAEAIRDVTLRPASAQHRVSPIVDLAVSQALQMADPERLMARALADGWMSWNDYNQGPRRQVRAAITMSAAGDELNEIQELAWLADWHRTTPELLARLQNARIVRVGEIEPLLASNAISRCTHWTIGSIEWTYSLVDPHQYSTERSHLWNRLWRFFDRQPKLTHLCLTQTNRGPHWSEDYMSVPPKGIASRLQHLSLGGQLGTLALESPFLRGKQPALRSLTLYEALPSSEDLHTLAALANFASSPLDILRMSLYEHLKEDTYEVLAVFIAQALGATACLELDLSEVISGLNSYRLDHLAASLVPPLDYAPLPDKMCTRFRILTGRRHLEPSWTALPDLYEQRGVVLTLD